MMIISTQPAKLYKGEILSIIGDAPTLCYFSRGSDVGKPLVVFIPGGYHLGRISHGGHEGSTESDFLSYWFNQAGYNFLAISYPLESTPTLMPATRPDFTVQEWGRQAAEATRRTMMENSLPSRNVLLIFWSMGGKILQAYTSEARTRGIDVLLAVSLAATPAVRGLREGAPGMTVSRAGYALAPRSSPYLLSQLIEQNDINGGLRAIIPEDIYQQEYLGNYPIALSTCGMRWSPEQSTLVVDQNTGFEVADHASMSDLPFLGSIVGDSPLDFHHAVADHATWSFLATYQLMAAVNKITASMMVISAETSGTKQRSTIISDIENSLSLHEQRCLLAAAEKQFAFEEPERATKLIKIIHNTVAQMTVIVHGNHFMFLGEKGAKQVTNTVIDLLSKVDTFKKEITIVLE